MKPWEGSVRCAGRLLFALLIACSPVLAEVLAVAQAGTPGAATTSPDPAPVASRVTTVVVFPSHAQVTRTLAVDAVAGENRVLLGGLVPNLNPHSLRASVGEGARVTGTEINTIHLEQSSTEQIAALDASIRSLDDQLALHGMSQSRAQERRAFFRSVKDRLARDMEGQFATGAVAVSSWVEVLAFVDEGLEACDETLATLELESRGVRSRREAEAAQRKDYAALQPHEQKQVAVSFEAERAGPVELAVHYMVAEVQWKPSYDVHLDRASGELELIGYGNIRQWSGEAWDHVDLTLAMSRPDNQLTVPVLAPLVASLDYAALAKLAKEASFLGSSEGYAAQKWAAGRFTRSQDRETFRRNLEQLAGLPRDRMNALGLSAEIIEGALSRLVDRFAGVRYEIGRRATIPFDSSPHKVVTFTARVPAQLRYVATPALGDAIMLQGAAVNRTGHPVLEGNAALFVDGSFVGSSTVAGAAQNEGLSFGFGPDDALVVKRRMLSRAVTGPEAFRQSQVLTYRYAITVENFNDRPVDVHVVDQIPISKTDEIQVTFLESSEQHVLNQETGALSWDLKVGAGKSSTIGYSFSVECPVGRDVHWQ